MPDKPIEVPPDIADEVIRWLSMTREELEAMGFDTKEEDAK